MFSASHTPALSRMVVPRIPLPTRELLHRLCIAALLLLSSIWVCSCSTDRESTSSPDSAHFARLLNITRSTCSTNVAVTGRLSHSSYAKATVAITCSFPNLADVEDTYDINTLVSDAVDALSVAFAREPGILGFNKLRISVLYPVTSKRYDLPPWYTLPVDHTEPVVIYSIQVRGQDIRNPGWAHLTKAERLARSKIIVNGLTLAHRVVWNP